ncbi:MAG: hypothetical protein Q4B95_04885 [Lonepinella koalarum]|nr:hypothetical protein [Lonepinella koalarum]
MASIDRMDWHYGGDYPSELPTQNAGTHIGMFLAWAFSNGLIGELHLEEYQDELKKLAERKITGVDFLIDLCDEKLWDEDFDDIGAEFAVDYYQDDNSTFPARYLDDYADVFKEYDIPTLYHLPNTWENFDKLKPILDQRFKEWKKWKGYK